MSQKNEPRKYYNRNTVQSEMCITQYKNSPINIFITIMNSFHSALVLIWCH